MPAPGRSGHGWLPDARAVGVLVLAALCLWTLAYQVVPTVLLPVGGDSETRRRHDDAPFLTGFHAPEPDNRDLGDWWTLPPGYTYRWTYPEANITLPGIGGGRWLITLTANSGRATGSAALAQVRPGDAPPLTLPVAANPRHYHVLAHATPGGSVRLDVATDRYTAPGDPRPLGVVVQAVSVRPLTSAWHVPAWGVVGWLLLAVLLSYGLVRWMLWGVRAAMLHALLLVVGLAAVLAWQRFALTLVAPTVAGLVVLCWLVAGVAGATLPLAGGRRWAVWRSTAGAWWQRGQAWAAPLVLALLALCVRLGGMLHPQARFSDHRLHANNVLEVALGHIYFTEGLPASRGGGQVPYPPGGYLTIAPLLTLLPGDIESRVLLVQVASAVLDSAVVLLLWLVLRRGGVGQTAAVLAAALYVLPPPVLASFSIGEYANLIGQALAVPVLALLAVQRSPRLLPLAALVAVPVLSHLGVTISLVLVLVVAWVLLAWQAWRVPHERARLATLTAAGALAAAVAGGVYYSAPQYLVLFAERSARPDSPATAPDLLPALLGVVQSTLLPDSRMTALLVVVGVAGVGVVWLGRTTAAHKGVLAWVLLAWLLGVLASFGLLLVAQQGVRWQQFSYPLLCAGGGVVLAMVLRRGRAGRVVASAVVLWLVVHGVTLWVWQVYDYLH